MDLKAIDRTDRALARLNAAFSIYRETILPEAQNPERQILYWIEHSKSTLTDEFKCFALTRAKEVIGYLQYSYFREEHVFFFEYLCLRDKGRRGLVPSEAVKSIENFLAQNYAPDFTIVFEVAHRKPDGHNWLPDRDLLKYFTRLGFRQVEFPYRYPVLQSYDGETSYPADLMVRLPRSRFQLSASEIRTILRCIYFKHYLRWDRPFVAPEAFGDRERLINHLYSREIAEIGDDDTFGTKGDDARSKIERFANRQRSIKVILEELFGPKLVRIVVLALLLLIAARALNNIFLFIPFVLAIAALYCLVEDTEASRKLFVIIMSRMRVARPRSS